jgi:hypothetical protein
MNASEVPQRFRITVAGLPGIQVLGEAETKVEPAGARWVPLAVQLPPEAARDAGPGAHKIDFHVVQLLPAGADAGIRPWERDERSTFVVPR